MLSEPLTEIKSADKVVRLTKPRRSREVVFEIADYSVLCLANTILKKVAKEKASEILMNAAELLGSRVYDEFVAKKIDSPREWYEKLNEVVFGPMGTKFKYKITNEGIEAEIFECPTHSRALVVPEVVCPFSYGFARALWRKSFPEGEIIMPEKTLAQGEEKCAYNFIVKPKEYIREEIKRMMGRASGLKLKIFPKPLTEFTIKIADFTIIALTDSIFTNLEKGEASELIITASEELGKTVFDKRVGKRVEKWTTIDWAKLTSAYIWNLQGTGVVFSEISDDKIIGHVFKCPNPERAGKAPHIACPFSWGYGRGVWKSAFPEGELLMGGTMAHGAPTCQFQWYTKTSKELSEERERAKRYLTKEEELRLL